MIEVRSDHPALSALFDPQIPNSPMLFSVLKGYNPGRVFVDNAFLPTQCVLSNNEGWTFGGGHITQPFLEEAIVQLTGTGDVTLVWKPGATEIQPPMAEDIVERVEYSERATEGQLSDLFNHRLTSGFELRQLDKLLLQKCIWRHRIEAACGSLDNFLEHGLGYCLVHGQHIVTEAYAPFWGLKAVEIGVVTNPAYRGQGYARITCAWLIQVCESRDFLAYWSCRKGNIASMQLARSLGFERGKDYQTFMYRRRY